MNIIEDLQQAHLKKIPNFRVGDTLKLSLKIVEGTRERVQAFAGTLIARKGTGLTETITIRRISFGEGVERTIPIHSPKIEKIEVIQRGHVRRAKLYYLRERLGKHAKIQDSKKAEEDFISEPTEKKIEKPKVLETKADAANAQAPKTEEKKEAKK